MVTKSFCFFSFEHLKILTSLQRDYYLDTRIYHNKRCWSHTVKRPEINDLGSSHSLTIYWFFNLLHFHWLICETRVIRPLTLPRTSQLGWGDHTVMGMFESSQSITDVKYYLGYETHTIFQSLLNWLLDSVEYIPTNLQEQSSCENT